MATVIYIPDGPKNLSPLFPGVDWDEVKEYYVEAQDADGNTVATTVINKMQCTPDQYVRVHFLNYLGGFDAVNFLKPAIVHEATDSTYQKSLDYPLKKTDTGIERFNVRSNDTFTTKQVCYSEAFMPWLQEMTDTPKAFIEWEGKEGQADDYLPVYIIEGKFDKQKNKDEYIYEFPAKFKLANEYITIRN